MTFASAIYAGIVTHDRTRPKKHSLRYRVFSLLLDLDELPTLNSTLRLFGYNRRAALTFVDADHGDGTTGGLRAWVDQRLATAGLAIPGGKVRVLCYPRMFGFVFNPLTVYFCYAADGELIAILYEVSNTHGERHTYVMPVDPKDGRLVRQVCRKEFFVSPFVEMDCAYHFRIAAPEEKVVVSIVEHDVAGSFLSAVFSGHRRPLTDGAIARALLAYPLMTLKVIVGIHVEAIKLWWKGVPVVPYRPAARRVASSVGSRPEMAPGE